MKTLLTSVAVFATLGSAALAQSGPGSAGFDSGFIENSRDLNDATAFDRNLDDPAFREPGPINMGGERLVDLGNPIDPTDGANKLYVDNTSEFLGDWLTDENDRLKQDIETMNAVLQQVCAQVAAQSLSYSLGGILGGGGGGGVFTCPVYTIFSDDSANQAASTLGWMDGYYDGYNGIAGDYDGYERISGGTVTDADIAARASIGQLEAIMSRSSYRTNYYNAYFDGFNDRRFGRPFDDGF